MPGMLSMLAYHSPKATVKGLKDFPKDERPPVAITFWSFRIMVGLGFLFPLLALIGWLKRKTIENYPRLLKIFLISLPLPYIALQAGWTLTEVGRQPWIVYGLLKTKDAASALDRSQVMLSFAGLVIVYTLIGLIAAYLIVKFVKEGPETATE
jgi:cytochrome d ubiquinol oxidase subunit I